MQNNSNYYNDEMEIDILDLCKVLFSKWKWLICGLFCGLIAALGFTALKPTPAVLSVEEHEEQLLERISETDKNYVEDLYQS